MKQNVKKKLSEEQKVFLSFLRNALYSDSGAYIIDTPKSYDFWKQIADLSAIHHVLPMIYEQVKHSNLGNVPDQTLMKDWKFKTVQSVLTQEKNTSQFLKIYQKLQNAGYHPLVVKGIILRSLYPNPEYRSSSDEDFWIKKEEYAGCEALLLREGFEKAPYSNEEKMAFDHKASGFHMEVHLVPFASYSALAPVNAAFAGCFDRAMEVEIQGVVLHTLRHEEHMNYMIAHCYQHFSSCGVGIRQIADLMKYAQAYGGTMDWTKVEAFAEKYHLSSFWKCTMAVARQYLGFSCETAHLPEADCTVQEDLEELVADILCGGVYGQATRERVGARVLLASAVKDPDRTLLSGIWKAVFVPQRQLQRQYPWLQNRPYLLPWAWMVRILEKFQKYNHKTIANAITLGSYRTQLAKKYHFI